MVPIQIPQNCSERCCSQVRETKTRSSPQLARSSRSECSYPYSPSEARMRRVQNQFVDFPLSDCKLGHPLAPHLDNRSNRKIRSYSSQDYKLSVLWPLAP